jgi:hypothetical protein
VEYSLDKVKGLDLGRAAVFSNDGTVLVAGDDSCSMMRE